MEGWVRVSRIGSTVALVCALACVLAQGAKARPAPELARSVHLDVRTSPESLAVGDRCSRNGSREPVSCLLAGNDAASLRFKPANEADLGLWSAHFVPGEKEAVRCTELRDAHVER